MSLSWRLPSGRGLWISRRFSPPTAKETAASSIASSSVFSSAASATKGGKESRKQDGVRKRSTSHAPTSSFHSSPSDRASRLQAPGTSSRTNNGKRSSESQSESPAHEEQQGTVAKRWPQDSTASGAENQSAKGSATPRGQDAHAFANAGQQQQQQQQASHAAAGPGQGQAAQYQQQPPQRPQAGGGRHVVNGWEWFPGHGWYPASWADLYRQQQQHPNGGFDAPSPPQTPEERQLQHRHQQARHRQQQVEQYEQHHQRRRAAQAARRRTGWLNSIEDFAFLAFTVGFVWLVVPDLADQIYLNRGADALASRIVYERAIRKKNKAKQTPPAEEGDEADQDDRPGIPKPTIAAYTPKVRNPRGNEGGKTVTITSASDGRDAEAGSSAVPVKTSADIPAPRGVPISSRDDAEAGDDDGRKRK
mmetsp:Transcript_50091/g.154772  ORF Transcript_50091/g.154772 Transcript_50091/m.154772 type:complete len:420 (-) Transcript_50091:41-1300(-)